jgi:large subunit ribosomal protein L4
MQVEVYNANKEVIGKATLPAKVFGLDFNPDLVKQAVDAQIANGRLTLAHTKDRSEVRGGGRKPWRQKGTGRARHGSNRSPIWIGGGVTFGPTKERNFSKRINKKAKTKALLMALSSKAKDKEIIVLDKFEGAKTKDLDKLLNTLLGDKRRSVLLVTPESNASLGKASRNIQKMEVIDAKSLNVVDVLKYKNIVLIKDAIKTIESHYKT